MSKKIYKRRIDGNYKGYTKESFYYDSIEKLWCWKQTSKDRIFKQKSKKELMKIKISNFVGQGNYKHKNDSTLHPGYSSTEEFAKLTGIGGKEYISMLLKRAHEPPKNYDKRAEGRQRKGIFFTECLSKSKIEFEQMIYKRKVWVFKNLTRKKIKVFKSLWQKN